MKTVTFSQLRNNAKKYFDAVEQGETVEVYRHGKPIAIVAPKSLTSESTVIRESQAPYTTGKGSRLAGEPQVSLSREVLRGRGHEVIPISETKRFVKEKFGALGTKGSLLKALLRERESERKREDGKWRPRKK